MIEFIVVSIVGIMLGYALGKQPGNNIREKFWKLIETPCDGS